MPALITLQIAVDVGTVDGTGNVTPCLALFIKGLGTNVVMHPWDIKASVSLSSLALAEMTYGTEGVPLYLVQTPVGAELLSVKFLKVVIIVLCVVDALLGESTVNLNSLQAATNKVWNILCYSL